jgi:VanZ family protein
LVVTGALSVSYLVVGLSPRVPAPLAGVSDVLLHAAAYAVLAGAATATALAFGLPVHVAVVASIAFATFHGAVLELLQRFVPSRAAEARDLLVDVLGAAVGAAPWWRPGGWR